MAQTPRPISQARCYNHPVREAVAICTVTNQPYCRECIVEHNGKMVSAAVVARMAAADAPNPAAWRTRLTRILLSAGAILLLAYGYYLLGRLLLAIPSRFHEGRFW